MKKVIPDANIRYTDAHFSFAEAGLIRKCPDCRQRFSQLFNIPECFWTDWCKRSNGYFGCENTYENEELESHSMRLRYAWGNNTLTRCRYLVPLFGEADSAVSSGKWERICLVQAQHFHYVAAGREVHDDKF